MTSSATTSTTRVTGDTNHQRRRKPISCAPCRHSKLRCDRQSPCTTCLKRGWQDRCAYGDNHPPLGRRSATRSTGRQPTPRRPSLPSPAASSQPPLHHDNVPSASPADLPHLQAPHDAPLPTPSTSSPKSSVEPIHCRWDNILRRPRIQKNVPRHPEAVVFSLPFGPEIDIADLLNRLPPPAVCEYLVSRYFANICPLFRILHGPTFQRQYSAFVKDDRGVDLSWLALLFTICSLTAKTIPATDPALLELWQDASLPKDMSALSQRYRDAAVMSLSQDQFLIRHNLNTLEALLVLVHTISDCEGAEYGWTLLGVALNIAIALRCHVRCDNAPGIERERRLRCWAGILILHTSQSLLFRDTDLSYLCNMKAPQPADADDVDILPDRILARPTSTAGPTQMSLMRFQIRLFHMSTDICNHITGSDPYNEDILFRLDAELQAEQARWDALYLIDGARSLLDHAGYAHWCVLQTYAHQLYLLLHRPFHSSRSGRFRQASRDRCIDSSLALMDLHRQLYELPRLQSYRWLVEGSISCTALHGAVALTSCLLEMEAGSKSTEYLAAIDNTVQRLQKLRGRSPACASVYHILQHLQSSLTMRDPVAMEPAMESKFDDWISNIDWFRPDDIGWDFWDLPNVDAAQTTDTMFPATDLADVGTH